MALLPYIIDILVCFIIIQVISVCWTSELWNH